MSRRSFVAAVLPLLVALGAPPALSQPRPIGPAEDAERVVLRGNVPPSVRLAPDLGAVEPDRPMERMILALKLRPGADAELARLLDALQDPRAPEYRRWLTPEEFGRRFGASDEELALVTSWLESQGFSVDEVGAGRTWINFSGDVRRVETAFLTPIRRYLVDGALRQANAAEPSIPRALAGLVHGPVSLNDIPRRSFVRGARRVDPAYTGGGGAHYLAPGDFATIYDVAPLWSGALDGTGQSVAVVGRTEISLSDVQGFRSRFGLPARDPVFVNNGPSPGNLGGGEEMEADLDVEWSGAVAKGATVRFVISKSTATTDGVDLSAQYIVQNDLAPVMTTSFGACEQAVGSSGNAFYANLWAQAAAQGITSLVSSGDSGAAGCDAASSSSGTGLGVNALSSTPSNVAVGGSLFADTSNPSAWWAPTNAPDGSSALSYIPEVAWNESGSVAGGHQLWATGGGQSTVYAKPSWQVAPGVPADGVRDVPDVSLSAAQHDGYLVEQGGSLWVVGGTSASSPSFAGILAIVTQKVGARLGNANVRLYQLAQAQYGSGGTAVFHDVTSGSNSVPGVTGFSCGAGYDAVTGVGTVDAAALAFAWAPSSPLAYYTLAPCRVLDTRVASGPSAGAPALSSGETRAVVVAGRCAIPSGAAALSGNVTVTGPGAPGYLTVFSGDLAGAPGTSTLNFTPGMTRANNVVIPLGTGGVLKVLNGSLASADFILDVNGYLQ